MIAKGLVLGARGEDEEWGFHGKVAGTDVRGATRGACSASNSNPRTHDQRLIALPRFCGSLRSPSDDRVFGRRPSLSDKDAP